MKRTNRILLGIGCVILLLISWLTAVTAKTNAEKQRELIDQADAYLADEIYVLAQPLLEEAASYEDEFTLEAEAKLKHVYLVLIGQSGYSSDYEDLLDKQMARDDATPDIFMEAAQYYLNDGEPNDAFSVLKKGIEKETIQDDSQLVEMYEANRYIYETSRSSYQDVTQIHNGAIQVCQNGYWGLASSNGSLQIPCEYDAISTYSDGQVIVRRGEVISAVNSDNNRVALYHGEADSFGNYSETRMGLHTKDGWRIANGTFAVADTVFEEVGLCENGRIPAKLDGKWGMIDSSVTEWLLPAQFDDIIRDELGRSMAQNVFFAKKQNNVYLYNLEGEELAGPFEDARPFTESNWAAVKKNGKWGFIDAAGNVMLNPQYDDAESFSQHLAAVKVGQKWGYVSLYGELVIGPIFDQAKSFSQGCAPVRTGEGWQIITLVEYEEDAGL